MYTDEQLAAMTLEEAKAALKSQQVAVTITLKEKFHAYAEKFLENHGVSVQIATVLSAIAADAVYNLVSNLVQTLLK